MSDKDVKIYNWLMLITAVIFVWLYPVGLLGRAAVSPFWAGWKKASVICKRTEDEAAKEE